MMVLNMNINRILCRTAFFGCVSLATSFPVFGDPGSDEIPVYNASKEAFQKYSKPLDEERVKKLKDLGYDNKFRVISFDSICNGFEKKAENFDAGIKDYKTTFIDWIKAVSCSFVIKGDSDKEYNVSSLLPSDFFETLRYRLAGTYLASQWSEKQKQVWELFRVLSGKNKYLLKITSSSGKSGRFETNWEDKNSARIIYLSHSLIFDEKEALHELFHEVNHALHYELGLFGDPALCSYTTKFIRDVYRISSKGSLLTERTVSAMVKQCPEIAYDWGLLEEAWNMLGFIEIDGMVYINELCDVSLPYDAKPEKDAGAIKFFYHSPSDIAPYFLANPKRIESWLNWENEMIYKDYRMGKWENFNSEDKDNAGGSRYLEAIAVALDTPPFDDFYQGHRRVKMRDCAKFMLECMSIEGELKKAGWFFEKSDPENPDFDKVLP